MRLIERRKWTQAQAAEALGISQSRVSDLIRGKCDKFSVGKLLTLASRVGLRARLKWVDAA
jgi:predicted XRE-type DNA-binding protein